MRGDDDKDGRPRSVRRASPMNATLGCKKMVARRAPQHPPSRAARGASPTRASVDRARERTMDDFDDFVFGFEIGTTTTNSATATTTTIRDAIRHPFDVVAFATRSKSPTPAPTREEVEREAAAKAALKAAARRERERRRSARRRLAQTEAQREAERLRSRRRREATTSARRASEARGKARGRARARETVEAAATPASASGDAAARKSVGERRAATIRLGARRRAASGGVAVN